MGVATAAVRPSRRLLGALSWLIALALAAGWAVYLRPASLGGPAGYVIVSGTSMEPLMHTGDLAVVHRQPTYAVGEVVAYRIPKQDVGGGMLVIHRVIGGDEDDGLVLQGDNRDTKDMWRPRGPDVLGALQWHVPHAGTALFLLRTPLVVGAVVAFLGFWFVVTWPGRGRRVDPEDAGDLAPDLDAQDPPPVAAPANPSAGRRPSGALAAGGVIAISVVAYAWQHRSDRP